MSSDLLATHMEQTEAPMNPHLDCEERRSSRTNPATKTLAALDQEWERDTRKKG